ncbi:NADH pyrophosphatase [Geomonas silvestris]|uniref:NAD(+) diphosphatase n=1 Tax=Geomonas silvestris TaxID=2740184 RepID=A0A6V8MK82_9BACT|nr:NAD(+) diphosphatase [Geomonas silvestris]GFO60398.1 NADH pyrophosphatase [Geomonas silvestris]
MAFPDAVHLPFNGEIIKKRFTQRKPGELDETAAGFWVFLQGDALILADGALYRGDLPATFTMQGTPLLFGEWDGEPVRLMTVAPDQLLTPEFQAVPSADLPYGLMTLYGLARQILYWERMSRHCSKCGASMKRIRLTWGKRCTGCGHEHFPHIHPCVIVLIRRGEKFLLARKPEWPQGRYSLVAGFLDFGESLEECVDREVFEETGLKVANLRYVGSQNWPFPSQMMAGFVADYASGEITVDGDELEDAQWFSPDRMPDSLPPERSIARWIIDRFALGCGEPAAPPAPASALCEPGGLCGSAPL